MRRSLGWLLLLWGVGAGPAPPALAVDASHDELDTWSAPGEPDPEPYYFYRGAEYGSEALLHPFRLIVNGGFGILQLDNRPSRLDEIDYANGLRNVGRNLADPFAAIQQHGWWDFLQREVIPVSFNNHKAHYWPNYTQHLIGGGMSYRLYVEWFRYHGYPNPKLLSGLSVTMYHVLNEVVENHDLDGWTTDPVADLYLFDPLGMLLFSSDRVSRFFGHTLNMADWSYQPSLDLADARLENGGQNFAMKLRLPWSQRWHAFYHFGTHGEGGLSFKRRNGESISVGVGLKAGNLIDLTEGVKSVELAASGGVFYDRHNSLLASLLLARTKDYRMRLNVYPGVLRLGPLSPGLFVADKRSEGIVFGVTIGSVPSIPVGIAGATR
jgi:hypothetical protein